MTSARIAAIVLGSARIAYAAALIAAPERVGRPWIGKHSESDAAKMTLRALGARDAAIGAGMVVSAGTGAPVRPWLGAAIAGDCMDIVATFAAKEDLPDRAPTKVAGVGGGSAALNAAVLAWVDS